MDIFDVFVDMQATGDKIKQLRKQNHYRVFDLANALGLESEQAIYKWQRGQCLPNTDNLVRLSILFGCHIEDILIHNMTTGEDESPLLPFLRAVLSTMIQYGFYILPEKDMISIKLTE
ncbi:MAG: helix-turn-helix transcriptional regulator [Butyrivibrio sp.]|uniref:helix-turn-helix domain-containing protein n=1 Tax=Butyrivibrio sp. TaxID=28121 RepID=UPI001B183206|nr:helix-turn-helix transcriptional regulator [Butyrivibrio sp.]MBO6241927.1 helix-turn-helix transcriptional regulator [Butyrivibrio sp.]